MPEGLARCAPTVFYLCPGHSAAWDATKLAPPNKFAQRAKKSGNSSTDTLPPLYLALGATPRLHDGFCLPKWQSAKTFCLIVFFAADAWQLAVSGVFLARIGVFRALFCRKPEDLWGRHSCLPKRRQAGKPAPRC